MPSEAHRKRVALAYLDAVTLHDVDAMVALFAENAVVEDPFGDKPAHGLEEIRAAYSAILELDPKVVPGEPCATHEDTSVAVPIVVVARAEPGGTGWIRIRSIDVMEFDTAGKITRMRGFWGPGDITPVPAPAAS